MADGLNDSEYRRGLVLGLTLAEVLLLLLFLVLLALTALYQAIDQKQKIAFEKFGALQREYGVLERERDAFKAAIDGPGSDKERAETARAISFYRSITELVPEQQLGQTLDAVRIAAELDPKAPPAVLVEGTKLVKEARLTAQMPAAQQPAPVRTTDDKALKGGHDWPPIITLNDAEGHFFASGSAEVPSDLQQVLVSKVVTLRDLIAQYKVDVIEVIGHTDEQAITGRATNLDHALLPLIRGATRDRPISADNAGLGLARAAAVVRILRSDGRLKDVEILPLSAGQLIDVGDQLPLASTGAAAAERRRIEIRLRRRSREAEPVQTASVWKTEAIPSTDAAAPGYLHGIARVVDGDTFDLGDTRIRLWGVDAIEGSQVCVIDGKTWGCGEEAARRLKEYLSAGEVRCEPKDHDRYGRTVAACSIAERDIGGWLVAEGLAMDYEKYSKGFYHDQQAKAQNGKLGIWRSSFIPPWEWRHINEK